MIDVAFLLAAAFGMRAGGAMVRGRAHHAGIRVTGWVLCAMGAWVFAGAVGAWFPVWPILLLGVLFGLAHLFVRTGRQLMLLMDVGIVMTAGMLSVPAVDLGALLAAGSGAAIVGFVLDEGAGSFSRRARLAMFGMPVALIVSGVALIGWRTYVSGQESWMSQSPVRSVANLGITRAFHGDRVLLENGAIGWLYHPKRQGESSQRIGAIILHGAHQLGSKQGSACVLRRALLDAGFTVMCVDHPGFGHSPPPPAPERLDSWDTVPVSLAAVSALEARGELDHILVVGHSMGSAGALRLLAESPNVNAAVIFGAAAPDSDAHRDTYWHRRFHADRRLSVELNQDHVTEIRNTFYDATGPAKDLRDHHGHVTFVSFGIEHDNIVRQRNVLYETVSSSVRSRVIELPNCTHYFNTFNNARFALIGDTRVPRQLSRWLRSVVLESDSEVFEGRALERRVAR